jgi:UDP-N-acetylmuramoyl-tripeptide--D-alanyl-D-alanine ligase
VATPIPENRAPFTAAEIAVATGGALVRGAPASTHAGVTTDSRAVKKGNVFVALSGASHDGHKFLGTAIGAGATAIVVKRGTDLDALPHEIAIVVVDDTLEALGALATAHRLRWAQRKKDRAVVIGITGSTGKTSTKELCAAACMAGFGDDRVLVTAGNLNNRIGVPLTLFGLEERHDVAVIEMGTSVRGEIAALCGIAVPHVGLLTNVGVAHAEGLLAKEEIGVVSPEQAVAREKRSLLEQSSNVVVANGDDPWATASLVDVWISRARRFGRARTADWRVFSVDLRADGTSHVVIDRPSSSADRPRLVEVDLPFVGEAAASNLAGALCAADAAMEIFGRDPIDEKSLARSIAVHVKPVHGRLCPRRRTDGALVLDDSYNASPAAYKEAIRTAKSLAIAGNRRLLVIAGEMRELGSIAASAHEEVAQAIVDAAPSLVVTIGPEAERIAFASKSARIDVHVSADSKRAAAYVAPLVEANDLVLVKGSRGVETERVVDAILARGGEITDATSGPSGHGGA